MQRSFENELENNNRKDDFNMNFLDKASNNKPMASIITVVFNGEK